MSATGVWRNHESGVLTLTLKDREGGYLAAALLIFASFASSQAWNIVKLVLHQAQAMDVDNRFRRRRQLILRNTADHTQSLWLTMRLFLESWRDDGAATAIKGCILLITVSLISLTGWSAARVFMSLIWTTAGDQFLAFSDSCGLVLPTRGSTSKNTQGWAMNYKYRLDDASMYQAKCYAGEPTEAAECGRFPVPRIEWAATDADCPFASRNLCILTNSTPVRMDSGFVNSNAHLGANAALGDTIEYRKVATCSPMPPNYTTYEPATGRLRYNYGQNLAFKTNETFWYANQLATITTNYQITSFGYIAGRENPSWRPNTTIFDRLDAMMSIYFLTPNYMVYLDPVYDPLFLTDPTPQVPDESNDAIPPVYVPASPVTILGCVEQHELCNPSPPPHHPKCTVFTRAARDNALFASLQLNAAQRATATRLRVELMNNDLQYISWMLTQPLLASRGVVLPTQYANLPHDQWRREVARWFDVSLAMLQSAFVEFATGPLGLDAERAQGLVTRPEDLELRKSCGSQRVRKVAGLRNFNLAAIIWVVVPGLVIVVMGLTLDTSVKWLQRRFKRGLERGREWDNDGLLWLERPDEKLEVESKAKRPEVAER